MSREEARALAGRVLALSRADAAALQLGEEESAHLRFARNAPSTSGSRSEPWLRVTSCFGTRRGTALGNQFDEDSLIGLVRRSESLARLAPEDPEFVPPLGPQPFAAIDAFDGDTLERGAAHVADGVARCLAEARAADLQAAGFASAGGGCFCAASSRGLFGYHRWTAAYAAETARTRDGSGSGWAARASDRSRDVDFGAVSRTALEKARASAAPRPLAPGRYRAILEPACTADLAQQLLSALEARPADEGRSAFSAPGGGNRIGERLFAAGLQLYSDPADPRAPAAPFGPEGLPQRRRDWVRDGTLAGLVTERFWAERQGVEPVPYPSNLVVEGGSGSLADLIADTDRAVLVTSLWYIRSVDPRTLLLTGLTRDGVFWIEKGAIAHPIANLRWNDSPLALFRSAEALTASVRTASRDTDASGGLPFPVVAPALRVGALQFDSVSDAV